MDLKGKMICGTISAGFITYFEEDVRGEGRHVNDGLDFFDCPVVNCQRKGENGFIRRDHLLEH